MRPFIQYLTVVSIASVLFTGCATANHTQRGALAGTALGTTAGAIIGHQSGHGAGGAAIGAVAGGLAGALAGNAADAREERDAAIARAEYAESQQAAAREPAMTNSDLIRMAQSGLSDEVIINAIRSRGGRFDLSPDGLIALGQGRVSDRVIREIQTAGTNRPTTVTSGAKSSTLSYVVVVPPVAPGIVVHSAPRHRVVVAPPRTIPFHGRRRHW